MSIPLEPATGSVDTLNALLRGEFAAVEAYELVIERYGQERVPELAMCLASHRRRVEQLRERILRMEGVPAQGAKWWGGFPAVSETIAVLISLASALVALDQAEAEAEREYREEAHWLDRESRAFLDEVIMPQQVSISSIVKALRSSSSR